MADFSSGFSSGFEVSGGAPAGPNMLTLLGVGVVLLAVILRFAL